MSTPAKSPFFPIWRNKKKAHKGHCVQVGLQAMVIFSLVQNLSFIQLPAECLMAFHIRNQLMWRWRLLKGHTSVVFSNFVL